MQPYIKDSLIAFGQYFSQMLLLAARKIPCINFFFHITGKTQKRFQDNCFRYAIRYIGIGPFETVYKTTAQNIQTASRQRDLGTRVRECAFISSYYCVQYDLFIIIFTSGSRAISILTSRLSFIIYITYI